MGHEMSGAGRGGGGGFGALITFGGGFRKAASRATSLFLQHKSHARAPSPRFRRQRASAKCVKEPAVSPWDVVAGPMSECDGCVGLAHGAGEGTFRGSKGRRRLRPDPFRAPRATGPWVDVLMGRGIGHQTHWGWWRRTGRR